MKNIVVFDFDGTLTCKDSFVEFIRFACGQRALYLGFLRYAHILVLMLLHLYSNEKAKEQVFSHFFKGTSIADFNALCQKFALSHIHILRPEGIKTLKRAEEDGAEVLIISASVDNWVSQFFPSVRVLGTQIEVKGGYVTGRFLSSNCFGQEKVNRLLAVYPNRSEYHLTAYGDSRGDKEMLAFADESHFKPFRV